MTKYVNLGNSIEASRTDITTRKLKKASSSVYFEGVGRFFKYKTKINSNIKITEELVPKEPRISPQSFLDLNDELDGDIFEIYTDTLIDTKVISNFSNVHGIQSGRINSFTYAKIMTPWRFILEQRLNE